MSEREDGAQSIASMAANALFGKLKLRDDTSSEERYINRSLKIRRLVLEWMFNNVDELFESWEQMGGEAGNYCKTHGLKDGASAPTCTRWIHQYALSGEAFHIESQPAGYVIRLRKETTP